MNVDLLLVPYDTALRGWRMGAGPERLLDAGLVSRLESLGYSVSSSVITPERDAPAEIGTAFDLAYVHCDLDALDPAEGRANPFTVAGGLTVAEMEAAVREIGRSVPLKAGAVTAYAPEYDTDGRIAEAALRIIEALLATASES